MSANETPQPQPTERRALIISVIGAGAPSERGAALAEAVGRELAKRGCVVACGGLGGVMEAAARGAKSAGGRTIGILPGNDSSTANEYIDYPIVTGMGHARNAIVVKTGRAVIAVDGAYGTLSEIGHALADGIPVIGLATWDLPRRDELAHHIVYAQSPTEAVESAVAAAQARAIVAATQG